MKKCPLTIQTLSQKLNLTKMDNLNQNHINKNPTNPSPTTELKEILSPYRFDFSRLVVLIETAPQSCQFEQVMLTKEQFKAVSNLLFELLPKVDSETMNVTTRPTPVVEIKTDGIESFYPPEQIVPEES